MSHRTSGAHIMNNGDTKGLKPVTNQSPNTTQSPTPFKLRIEDHAFAVLSYLRDYKPDEVTMFGITKLDDPLYVTEFALVKQKVNYASSDCDPEGMVDHICKYINKGIPPLNSERIWFHTHPMTGDSSANPSTKDMNTWNDPDNKHKNFMVMGILSKSGQITCKLRIRGDFSSIVTGLNSPLVHEVDIPIEIVKTDYYKQALVDKLTQLGASALIEAVGREEIVGIFSSKFTVKDLFPEQITALEKEYSELVSKDVPVIAHHNVNHIGIGFNHYYSQGSQVHQEKKTPSASTIPEMMVITGEDVGDLDSMLSKQYLASTAAWFVPAGEDQVRKCYGQYVDEWKPSETDYVSAILGAIAGDMIKFDENGKGQLKPLSNITLIDKRRAVTRSMDLYPTMLRKLNEVCGTENFSSI